MTLRVGKRVQAIPETHCIRAGALGTVIAIDNDEEPGVCSTILVRWDDSNSGPIWHNHMEIEEV